MPASSHGFTLIETLAASAVLLFGVAAVASLIAVSVETRAGAERKSRAQALAAARLEALRLEVRAGASPGGTLEPTAPLSGFHDHLRLGPDGEPVIAGPADASFLRLWRIEPDEPVRMAVAVYWLRRSGRDPLALARVETALAGLR